MTHVATATGEATAPYLCGGEVCPESGVGHLLLPTGRDILPIKIAPPPKLRFHLQPFFKEKIQKNNILLQDQNRKNRKIILIF